jgi:hypothetical protein
MDSIRVPETTNEAVTTALDLDGDDQPDNAVGGLLAALHGSADLSIAATQMEAVESGQIIELVGIDAASLDDVASVPVLVSRGRDVDGEPTDNFSGAEPFALDPVEGADGELSGALSAGRLTAGPGTASLPLLMFDITGELVPLHVVGARVAALASADGLAAGRFGGGLTNEAVHEVLIPALADGIGSILQRDCDADGCLPGSQGEQLAELFDENADYLVTAAELETSSLTPTWISSTPAANSTRGWMARRTRCRSASASARSAPAPTNDSRHSAASISARISRARSMMPARASSRPAGGKAQRARLTESKSAWVVTVVRSMSRPVAMLSPAMNQAMVSFCSPVTS